MDRKTSIFLDTNIIQAFTSGKKGSSVFLDNLGIRKDYYTLTDFISNNGLEDEIEICIPEIVVMEMKHHMIAGFDKQLQQLNGQIEEHKKMFGNLADFSAFDVKHSKDKKSYADYVDSLIEDFFNTPKNYAKQIPFPRHEPILDTLVSKAISGTRPFFTGKIESKTHTDAGFKDSVIAETIYEYSRAHERLCIFITKDQDFSPEFKNSIQTDARLVIFSSIDTAAKALAEYYGTDPQSRVLQIFREETYWPGYLLEEIGMSLDESVTERKVEEVSFDEEDVFRIKMFFVINETKYCFDVMFDSIASQIINFEYHTENE